MNEMCTIQSLMQLVVFIVIFAMVYVAALPFLNDIYLDFYYWRKRKRLEKEKTKEEFKDLSITPP